MVFIRNIPNLIRLLHILYLSNLPIFKSVMKSGVTSKMRIMLIAIIQSLYNRYDSNDNFKNDGNAIPEFIINIHKDQPKFCYI